MVTRSAVHWAARIVATSSSSGVVKSSAILASGYARSRVRMIFAARARLAAVDSRAPGLTGSPRRAGRRPGSGRGKEAAEPREPLPDALDGRGIREAKIPLPVPAEVDARCHGHVGTFENLERERERIGRVPARIGEDVEGAGRLDVDAEADRPQAVDHDPAALVEDRAEPTHLVTRLAKRRDARPLHELVRRDEEVLVRLLERPNVLARRD